MPKARVVRSLLPLPSLLLEEIAEDGAAPIGENAADGDSTMIQARIARYLIERVARSRLGIRAAVNDHWHARLHDGTRTHRARLEGNVKDAAFQPPRFERGPGLSRIVQSLAHIVGQGDRAELGVNDESADGNFVLVGSDGSFLKAHLHVVNVKGMVGIGERQIEGVEVVHIQIFRAAGSKG